MDFSKPAYLYSAEVVKVYDGDTITVIFDVGFNLSFKKQKIRLLGINAPEMRGETLLAARKSRDWLRKKILGKTVIIQTFKDTKGKYGRWLGVIHFEGENLNELLVEADLAVRAEY